MCEPGSNRGLRRDLYRTCLHHGRSSCQVLQESSQVHPAGKETIFKQRSLKNKIFLKQIYTIQYWDSAARKPLPPHQRKQMEADLPSAYNGKRVPASRSNSNASRKSKASKQDKTYEGHYYDDYYEETESDRGHQNSHHQSGKVGYGYKAQELDQRNNNNNEGDSGFFYEDGDSVADSNATFGCGEFEDPFTGEIRDLTQWSIYYSI